MHRGENGGMNKTDEIAPYRYFDVNQSSYSLLDLDGQEVNKSHGKNEREVESEWSLILNAVLRMGF